MEEGKGEGEMVGMGVEVEVEGEVKGVEVVMVVGWEGAVWWAVWWGIGVSVWWVEDRREGLGVVVLLVSVG